VAIKRSRDVRAHYDMLDEIGRWVNERVRVGVGGVSDSLRALKWRIEMAEKSVRKTGEEVPPLRFPRAALRGRLA